MKLTDIEFVKVDPIRNIKRMMSLKSAARRIREHNRIHYAAERNSLIITEILESCARLLEDIDDGKVVYVKHAHIIDPPRDSKAFCRCSNCGEELPFVLNYCGHCEAQIDDNKGE